MPYRQTIPPKGKPKQRYRVTYRYGGIRGLAVGVQVEHYRWKWLALLSAFVFHLTHPDGEVWTEEWMKR